MRTLTRLKFRVRFLKVLAKSEQSQRKVAVRWQAAWVERCAAWLQEHNSKLSVGLVLLASVRIALVYPVYNHTIDEPAHIACGMEWLNRGSYRLEPQHPPLARVAAALGPKLAGARFAGRRGAFNEGGAILYGERLDERRYWQVLTLARLGTLPFFWLVCAAVYFWGRQRFGPVEAVLSLLLVTLTPPILGHAALATTDMALTAGVAWAALAWLLWIERPNVRRTALLGLAGGLMVLTKFSSLVFFPAFAAFMLGLQWYSGVPLRLKCKLLPLALGVCGLVIWAGYRFSVGPGPWGLTLPAPDFWRGLVAVYEHNQSGHPSYLLGRMSPTGWWYYYPVVLALKTPLPLLVLAVVGVQEAWRRRPAGLGPLALAGGVLLAAMPFRINIGVRHILPVYVGISLMGSLVLARWLHGRRVWLGMALLIFLVGGGALAHPDYLAYVSCLAGNEPEKLLADSDVDWGQDLKRLSNRLRELGASQVAFTYLLLPARLLETVHGFPPIVPYDPLAPEPGWNAVSITMWKIYRMGLPFDGREVKLWPDRFRPVERVGRGILLYYFPPRFIEPLRP